MSMMESLLSTLTEAGVASARGRDVSNKHALSEAEGAGLAEVFKPAIHGESVKIVGVAASHSAQTVPIFGP
jgi:hypothetical protein